MFLLSFSPVVFPQHLLLNVCSAVRTFFVSISQCWSTGVPRATSGLQEDTLACRRGCLTSKTGICRSALDVKFFIFYAPWTKFCSAHPLDKNHTNTNVQPGSYWATLSPELVLYLKQLPNIVYDGFLQWYIVCLFSIKISIIMFHIKRWPHSLIRKALAMTPDINYNLKGWSGDFL